MGFENDLAIGFWLFANGTFTRTGEEQQNNGKKNISRRKEKREEEETRRQKNIETKAKIRK